ncbi:unnamed protein product [Litomosoides sigmodontis]|uniref:Uncharacterized protein n=1 Tax=Litomosoides sigmodontis TaxID=42156 RepID=A0A3P6SKM4_LITSI|nr:unnamed protein product [Litomosoides sigmodontis]
MCAKVSGTRAGFLVALGTAKEMAQIHYRNGRLCVAVGRNIFEFAFVVDNNFSKLKLCRDITVPFKDSPTSTGKEKDQILASALSADGTLFAVATTSKECFLYNVLSDWMEVRPALQLPKAPTAIVFELLEKFVIISDRAGNVRRYNLDQENSERDKSSEHNDDIDISSDRRFLISADRDEKIRISRYPECYIIHRFCLGHGSYVNSIQSRDALLFSSGGDGTLRVWDMENGNQISHCDCLERKPIRRFKMFPNSCSKDIKLVVIFEHCKTAQIVTFIQENNDFKVERLTCSDFIIDIAVEDSGIFVFGITRSSIVFGRVDEGCLESVANIDEYVTDCLGSVKESLLPLEKKTGFSNIEDYKQRKTERIKRKRRRLSVGNN